MKRLFTFAAMAALVPLLAVAQEVDPVDAAFEAMRTHTWEVEGNPGQPITDAIMAAQGDEAARAELADRLVTLLDAETTFAAKRFACQHLYIIGTAAQVPALAPMLEDPELAHLACYALQAIPGKEADDALVAALEKTDGDVRINIVNTLRVRAPEHGIGPLAALLPGESPEEQHALLLAIAAVGLAHDGDALQHALEKTVGLETPEMDERLVYDAALPLMVALAKSGEEDGIEMIRSVYEHAGSKTMQMAALEAWVNTDPASALPVVAGLLASDDAQWVAQACGYVRTLQAGNATEEFLAMLAEDLPPENKAIIITALVDRGDPAALPAVTAALDGEHEAVRAAALEGLGQFGNADSAVALAEAAANESGTLQRVARGALVRLPAAGTGAALLEALDQAQPAVKQEMIRALGDRGAREAFEAILAEASEGEEDVRKAAIDALGQLGRHDDVPAILALLPKAEGNGLRAALGRTIVNLARKADAEEGRAAALHETLAGDVDPATRTTLLALLGDIGDPSSLGVLENALAGGEVGVRRAATEALSAWPNAAAMETLLRLADQDPDEAVRREALDGYIRLLREGTHDKETLVSMYEKALELATSSSDQRKIFAGLAELRDRDALELVKRYLDDEELRNEAAVAAERIRSNFYELSASHKSDDAKYAMDGNIDRRWTSGTLMKGGGWFLIDMTEPATVAGLVLDNTRSTGDYPRGYEIYVTDDPENPGEPVAQGEGSTPVTEIRFEASKGRYVKIVQTGAAEDLWWSIDEMRLIAE